MKLIYSYKQRLKYVFLALLLVIGSTSIITTQFLVNKLATEERERMELWADATRELIRTDNFGCDLTYFQKVIEANHSIPVILVDKNDSVLLFRNLEENSDFQSLAKKFSAAHERIEVRISDNESQFILYDDSKQLKQLSYFPTIQIGVIFLFVLLSAYAFFILQKAEQNNVWIGLSRETAHQLGTPISSLLAWNEILKMRYPDDDSLPDMLKDIERLSVIAERFSKIGSKPELSQFFLENLVQQSIDYMQKRTSKKVVFKIKNQNSQTPVLLNADLFGWVLENLCKNAIDAMNGIGEINFEISRAGKQIFLDVSDTGKGIAASHQKAIFSPGYTTKTRGWGLGLSLAKRIIEEYHKGKIFVKNSELARGTTFRIILNATNS